MKRLYGLLAILFFSSCMVASFTSCDGENEEQVYTIDENDLPEDAKNFLDNYFYDIEVVGVREENDDNVNVYVVDLDGGYEVVFSSKGEWQQVVAPEGEEIPYEIVPEQVRQTLTQQYSGYGVREINTTGEGWKVELVTGLDLFFNMSGEITSTSQY